MKVHELVTILQTHDQNLQVLTQDSYLNCKDESKETILIEILEDGFEGPEGEFVSTGPAYLVLSRYTLS